VMRFVPSMYMARTYGYSIAMLFAVHGPLSILLG
jgi:hypothetical protein